MTHDVEVHWSVRDTGRRLDVRAPHRILPAITTNQPFSGLIVKPDERAFGHDMIVLLSRWYQ
jgi:hypothetical protein